MKTASSSFLKICFMVLVNRWSSTAHKVLVDGVMSVEECLLQRSYLLLKRLNLLQTIMLRSSKVWYINGRIFRISIIAIRKNCFIPISLKMRSPKSVWIFSLILCVSLMVTICYAVSMILLLANITARFALICFC